MVAIQDIQIIYGEISDDTWEEMVLVVRRTLHGIGEKSKQGRTFGWQQQFKNMGFRHISFTPKIATPFIGYYLQLISINSTIRAVTIIGTNKYVQCRIINDTHKPS